MSEINQSQLTGSWQLVAVEARMSDTGEVSDFFGPNPLGFCMFDDEGRFIVTMTAAGLTQPTTPTEFTIHFTRIIAYTGRYTIDGNRMVTKVDVSSHPSWLGTEQSRFVELNDDALVLFDPGA